MKMRVCGVDEAGKGPVIGPIVVCGVVCEEEKLGKLEEMGVKDSKKILPKKREELAEKVKSIVDYEIAVIPPEELNSKMENMSINEILKEAYAKIISKLNPDIAFVDSFDVKPERLSKELEELTGRKVVAMHNGERLPVVAAASIIAKCERERIIEELRKKYGDFGSGYASDEKTRKWLEKRIRDGELPEIVRKRWRTLDKLKQRKIFEFGD